jgi:hypothetical protein
MMMQKRSIGMKSFYIFLALVLCCFQVTLSQFSEVYAGSLTGVGDDSAA